MERTADDQTATREFERECAARGLVFSPSELPAVHRAYMGLLRSLATVERLAAEPDR